MSSNITVHRICEFCGSDFIAKTTVTRYCSDSCSSRARKAKARKAKIELSNAETYLVKIGRTEQLNSRDFLTIPQACELLSVSRWTLWRAVKNNELPSGKIGKRVILRRVDIDRLFEARPGIVPERSVPALAPQVPMITPADSYTIGEVIQKYNISDKAFRAIMQRNNIPKLKSGRFVYVPKADIDNIFKPQVYGS
jgi:excisionase family DNA binding protein